MKKGKHNQPTSASFSAAIKHSRSNTTSALPTPTTDTPPRVTIRDIKVNTDIPNDPALLDGLSPSVRGVAEHAAVLRSVLSRLGPIYDLVEREASRMTEVSPFLTGKDQREAVWQQRRRNEKIRSAPSRE
ncbi:hypothetical protein BDM02DRAFT_1003163 [Thelephora ganbajun]|uniref:Uncharacterized protein n=1 Tax=Thelephora ganbajun TaxID=370292 RepID=A0ACB6ZN55_THEGA|nr:hypothetical protein BDM02DRAFT_1003163 [Thelephora ganbajun]